MEPQNKQASSIIEPKRHTAKWLPKRNKCYYKAPENIEDILTRARGAVQLDGTGNTNQPSHPAHKKLEIMRALFVEFFDAAFPTRYFKTNRSIDTKVYQIIRLRSGDVASVISILNEYIVMNKATRTSITSPMNWCVALVEWYNVNEVREQATYEQALQLAQSSVSPVTVTEVPNDTKQIPQRTASNQPDSKPDSEQAPYEKYTGKVQESEIKEPSLNDSMTQKLVAQMMAKGKNLDVPLSQTPGSKTIGELLSIASKTTVEAINAYTNEYRSKLAPKTHEPTDEEIMERKEQSAIALAKAAEAMRNRVSRVGA